MRNSGRWFAAVFFAWLAVSNGFLAAAGGYNYREALSKSLLFLEAQRSGRLPSGSRVRWRGDSGLNDGHLANVDLVGGYYDAGDNVKYGLPMAFTMTTLAWGLGNALEAIRWGTDYFLKASSKRNRFWVQVGDPVADHQCWARPENMGTPRTLYRIDEGTPGTEIAAETAAAMAAASIVFRSSDHKYSRRLLNKAKLAFSLYLRCFLAALRIRKLSQGDVRWRVPFYCSYSGYNDELLWAATWLYVATRRNTYRKFITEEAISASVAEFSWDLKYAGVQVLLSGLLFAGEKGFENFKTQADNFVCAVLPESPYKQVYISPGGLIHLRDGANTQYVTSTAFILSIYSDMLSRHGQTVSCGTQTLPPHRLMDFAKQQMDYLLGSNPEGRSYMVGFGTAPPTQAHHRGASIPPLAAGAIVDCAWPQSQRAHWAIVGGPDRYDNFDDLRWDSSKLEPATYINSAAVAVLANLAAHS
ncbi:unnamed protein product [Spirodela intermedia]|uniref:Endoglucanase n=1 Tax=Spirodela intermedia TaxID=51605 RepID=A0A7I8J1X7_SPIIN|nr:unnamed protein product [Spirodela intermedia]CAA6664226.1 unnamed protein product [Spirodela intermedia]